MAQPNLSSVHINGPLTNMSIAYIQAQDKFIADKVFPALPVSKQSDLYFIFDKEDFYRDEMGKKAPGAAPDTGGYDITTGTPYYCHVYAYGHKIPDQVRDNADSPLNLDNAAMQLVTQKFLIKRERTFISNFMSTGVWGRDVTGISSGSESDTNTVQWDSASSSPIEAIRKQITYVEGLTGFRPNTLSLGRQVWDKFIDHPDILDRIKYSGGLGNNTPAAVNRAAVAQILEIDNVHVSSAVYNSAEKGATSAVGYIAGKNALLTYTPSAPGLMTPAAGLTFNWSGFLGSNGSGMRVKKYRLPEELESDQIEVQAAYDQKLIGSSLGVFFSGVVS